MSSYCLVCGQELTQPSTGRRRRFRSGRCRTRDHRELRKWASLAVDLALLGAPEPAKWWRYRYNSPARCNETEVVSNGAM